MGLDRHIKYDTGNMKTADWKNEDGKSIYYYSWW